MPDSARNVLEKHALLIDCQADLAKAQTIKIRLRHIGERVRAAMWAVLDMQERSESTRAASTYASNWEDELKIDIPNTGATTDQIRKLVRGWLGKETRISGEVIETGGGLALTTRVGAMPGRRFVSETRNLDELITKGAELIYKHTQPYRYAISLAIADPAKREERRQVLMGLTAHASDFERKWAYNGPVGASRNRRFQGIAGDDREGVGDRSEDDPGDGQPGHHAPAAGARSDVRGHHPAAI